MAAPQSAVDICNIALDHLGEPPIGNIDAPTTNAEKICARHYDRIRRGLLREYVWNFAKKQATITRYGDGPADWADAYALPNDFLRFISIGGTGDTSGKETSSYDIQGRYIMTNGGADSITIRYIFDEVNVSEWDALFVNLCGLVLAEAMAYKFTLKKGVVEQIAALIKQALPKATSIDGQEHPPRRIQRSKYRAARYGYATSYYDGMYTRTD